VRVGGKLFRIAATVVDEPDRLTPFGFSVGR